MTILPPRGTIHTGSSLGKAWQCAREFVYEHAGDLRESNIANVRSRLFGPGSSIARCRHRAGLRTTIPQRR